MKLSQFYKRLAKEIHENTHPDNQHIVKDLKITSLEQVLGIFRSVMIKNTAQHDEAAAMKKQLKSMMDVLGLSDRDL